jgi:hypothetical protein
MLIVIGAYIEDISGWRMKLLLEEIHCEIVSEGGRSL